MKRVEKPHFPPSAPPRYTDVVDCYGKYFKQYPEESFSEQQLTQVGSAPQQVNRF